MRIMQALPTLAQELDWEAAAALAAAFEALEVDQRLEALEDRLYEEAHASPLWGPPAPATITPEEALIAKFYRADPFRA